MSEAALPDPNDFERDMACTEAEWLRWLPQAVHGHALHLQGRSARVAIGDGSLHLAWNVLPPRRIALLSLPRMALRLRFEAVDDATRRRFLLHFDRHLQRGGG